MAALLANWKSAPHADRSRAMRRALTEHFRARWRAWLVTVALLLGVGQFLGLSVNISPSLPHHVYLILKWQTVPERDWYMAFTWGGRGPYPYGTPFVKQVVGMPGDTVTREGRAFFVNGRGYGAAKAFSLRGLPLEVGPTGVIPPDRYYVYATSLDSLDSRYEYTGWIPVQAMRGRAVPLF